MMAEYTLYKKTLGLFGASSQFYCIGLCSSEKAYVFSQQFNHVMSLKHERMDEKFGDIVGNGQCEPIKNITVSIFNKKLKPIILKNHPELFI